jgi:hypothetical protein
MTHEEKLQIDLLWYQAMEDCVKEDSVRYAFAALVRADEREQCAKVCEALEEHKGHACAYAIRARGKE